MFLMTDEKREAKMLPLRVRTRQHDSEVDSSADVNPQPPQVQFPLPNGASPAGPAGEADGPSLYPSTPQYQSSTRSPYYSIAYGTYSDRVEYPSRAACATRIQCYPPQCSNTKHKGPCWHALIRLRIWLFSFRSYACSRPHPDGWVIRHTSLPLIRILQPLQELESEAQLLNAPPLPIRKHPLQSSTFGTGLVDTTVRLTLEALILRFNTSDILGVLLCPRFAIRVRSCSTLSVSPIQACTCTCSPTVFPGTLYICRGSSVSVLPFGGTTDTARCTTYTADAGKLRLFDVRNPFN